MRDKIRVVRAETAYKPESVYDVNVTMPVVFRDKYRRRLDHFKRCGFYNFAACAVHLTLIGSVADWIRRDEIRAGWPSSFHVSVLAVDDERPLPKVSAGYVWQREHGPRARWHLRVDDDSMTDIGGMLEYVDRQYGRSAVHVMTSPYFNDTTNGPFIPYLKRHGIHLPMYANEHESSITSECAMQLVFAHLPAVKFLEFTCQVVDSQSDKCLPLAMLIAQVPVAINPVSTKHCALDELSLTGGRLHHIHYTDWDDPVFNALTTAFLHGSRETLEGFDPERFLDKRLSFGRCLGKVLGKLILLPDGTLKGGKNANEARWIFMHSSLRLMNAEGVATTKFDTVLRHRSRVWLIGPYLLGRYMHFLRLK